MQNEAAMSLTPVNVPAVNPVLDAASMRSFASSQLGLNFQLTQTNKFSKALSQPGQYNLERAGELKKIFDKVNESFVEKYTMHLSGGMAPATAQNLALRWAQSIQDNMMAELNITYPEDISRLAASMEWHKNGGTGNLNSEIAVHMPKARAGGGRRKRATKKK